jgi:hypothetical protein
MGHFQAFQQLLDSSAKTAVVAVGAGRGFVVNSKRDRLVVTAAHCLPFFPPCHGASYLEERTYKDLIAPLGSNPAAWAECLFADPIADIAVLGSPDNQELFAEAEEYEALVESTTPIAIADAPKESCAWLLSLDQKWFRCTIQIVNDGRLWVSNLERPVVPGMSGSPIILDDGTAIGVVALAAFSRSLECPNPRLVHDLPGWLSNNEVIHEQSKHRRLANCPASKSR